MMVNPFAPGMNDALMCPIDMLKGGLLPPPGEFRLAKQSEKRLHANSWLNPVDHIRIGGVPIAPLSTRQWLDLLLSDYHETRLNNHLPRYHSAANGQVISEYARNPQLRATLEEADAIAADGMPLVLFSWLTGRCVPDRAATTDLFHDIAALAQREKLTMYFLGGTEKENRAAVENVGKLYGDAVIAGRHHGFFAVADEPAIIAEIMQTKPDILWIGLGVPRQEYFALKNREALAGVTWIKTCGGLFNFLSGTNSRAPRWMQKTGLEWLYRTILEPRRLLWRYMVTNVHAAWLMVTVR